MSFRDYLRPRIRDPGSAANPANPANRGSTNPAVSSFSKISNPAGSPGASPRERIRAAAHPTEHRGNDPRPVSQEAEKRAREQRRLQAVELLGEMPTRRSAFIAGEPMEADIPVMVAVRTMEHGTVTGELIVTKERWNPASFLLFLDEMEERAAS